MNQEIIVFTAPETTAPVAYQTYVTDEAVANRPKMVTLSAALLEQMLWMTEAEIKTFLFIFRQIMVHTSAETISLTYSQIMLGVCAVDGRLIDAGTGLCHKSIGRAVRLLADKGYITIQKTGRPRRNVSGAPVDPALPTGTEAIYGLGYRMRPVRNWIDAPLSKPIPEARHGIKTAMPA